MRKIFSILAAALLLINFSVSSAFSLDEKGLEFDGAAKQNYMREKMSAYFHPVEGQPSPAVPFEVPDGWHYEKFQVDGVKVECLENPAAKTNRVVLQLHGGGYVLPLGDGHRNLGVIQGILADAAQVYLVDYRIAPQNIYPAALEDAVKAYTEILRRGVNPQNIIVIGDSAGGNLALALSIYLRDNKISQPKMLILASPWAAMNTEFSSRKYNNSHDWALGEGTPLNEPVKNPAYAKGFNLKDPRLSPLYANLKNLPPMLVQVGGYEIFLDEGLELAKKAAAEGVKVTLTVYPEMPHDFALLFSELKDGLDSFKEIRDFINANA